MSNHTTKLFRCEPQILGEGVGDRRVQLLQGGMVEGKPSIEFEIKWEGGTMNFLCWVHELRASLDILEPAPKKRERKPKAKPAKASAKAVLDRIVSREEEHHGE